MHAVVCELYWAGLQRDLRAPYGPGGDTIRELRIGRVVRTSVLLFSQMILMGDTV